MPRAQTFSSGVIVSSKFLNDVQQGLTGSVAGAALTAHATDVAKVSLAPLGNEVVAPIVLSSGTGALADGYAVGYKEGTTHSSSASGSAGTRNIWVSTTSAAQTATPGVYTVSVLDAASPPADAFKRKIGTAQWTGSALSAGRLTNGVFADAVQTNMFTFKSMFDTTTDIPLTLQGGVAQGAGNSPLLSAGFLVSSVYAEKWALGAKGRITTTQAASTDEHYRAFVGTDTQPLMSLTAAAIKLGPGGSTAVDTTISRGGAGVVKVDTTLDVVTIQNTAATGGAVVGSVNVADNLNVTGTISIAGTVLAAASLSDSALLARLASPAFTGTPTAPTATAGTNSTQLATTAYADRMLPLTGGTLSNTLNVNNGTAKSVLQPTGLYLYAAQADVNSRVGLGNTGTLQFGPGGASGLDWSLNWLEASVVELGSGDKIRDTSDPSHANDLARKSYVDSVGGIAVRTLTSASTTLLSTDRLLCVNYAGAVTVTVPAIPAAGKQYVVADSGGNCSATNSITLDPTDAALISGSATAVLMSPYDSITIVSNGTNWVVI